MSAQLIITFFESTARLLYKKNSNQIIAGKEILYLWCLTITLDKYEVHIISAD